MENKLTCAKCKEKQHYRCTGLPVYQIWMFLTPRYRSFVCVSCVPVTEELSDIVAYQEESIVEHLRRDVTSCENIVNWKILFGKNPTMGEWELTPFSSSNMFLRCFFRNFLKSLKRKKAIGLDKLPPGMLKDCHHDPLHRIINLSLQSGIVSSAL